MPQKELITLPIGDIQPYAKNPRKNDIAVEDVKQSIIQCSYIAPIIVDENNEVIAGHTRLKAFKELGYKEIEVLQITGLTEQQKRKGRLLDNKAAEKAAWDFELLAWETEDIDFEGYDFGFGSLEEVDIDGLFEDSDKGNAKKPKIITCPHCGEEINLDEI